MASLDQFLADLDDLNDEDGAGEEGGEGEDGFHESDDDDIDMTADHAGSSREAAGLLRSERMGALMAQIERYMGPEPPPSTSERGEVDDDMYSLIVSCNEMVIDIDNEVEALAKRIRDDYAKRFPELESLILNPLDYARVVLKIGNEADLTQVDLTGILPSATIMVVTVTASTTIGTELPPQILASVTARCEEVLALSDNKQRILVFVESKMSIVAPNVSAIVGSSIAAKLVGAAGGLSKLAELPSTVVQILGAKKKTLGGLSTATQVTHSGCIYAAELIQNTPPALRPKIMRMVAGKVTLAARADAYQDKGSGVIGQRFRDEIEGKSAKLQEPPPPKDVRPLPVPPESSGKRRGGRRLRKMKERSGMSHMRQLSNRVRFGQEEDTTSDGLLGVGMLGKQQQAGKLKVTAQQQKLLSEKNKKARLAGSSGSTNGLASSLAFTPVQGIELVNPSASQDTKEGTETYFSQQAAFFKQGL
eukprot:scaffold238513_cov31-Tisochrysis_lutea.AAC.1